MANLTEELKELRQLRERKEDAKAEADIAKAEYDAKQAEVLERMKEEGVESMKTDGVLFSPGGTPYGQVQDSEAFIEWAQEQDENLLEQKPRKELINQLVREHLDNGAPLPPGLGFYVREFVSQRAS